MFFGGWWHICRNFTVGNQDVIKHSNGYFNRHLIYWWGTYNCQSGLPAGIFLCKSSWLAGITRQNLLRQLLKQGFMHLTHSRNSSLVYGLAIWWNNLVTIHEATLFSLFRRGGIEPGSRMIDARANKNTLCQQQDWTVTYFLFWNPQKIDPELLYTRLWREQNR